MYVRVKAGVPILFTIQCIIGVAVKELVVLPFIDARTPATIFGQHSFAYKLEERYNS